VQGEWGVLVLAVEVEVVGEVEVVVEPQIVADSDKQVEQRGERLWDERQSSTEVLFLFVSKRTHRLATI
jgi:hypothetical protein